MNREKSTLKLKSVYVLYIHTHMYMCMCVCNPIGPTHSALCGPRIPVSGVGVRHSNKEA